MSEVKQINTLNTVASVRRAAQQAMRPVIAQVQAKMQAVQAQMQSVASQCLLFGGLQKKIAKHDETNRYFHVQLVALSDQLATAELQMTADREQATRNHEDMLYEYSRMRKENEKLQAAFKVSQNKTNKTLENIEDAQRCMKRREGQMQQNFKEFIKNSESFQANLTKSHEQIKTEFQKMKMTLNSQFKESERRIQMMDMYESQKQATFSKLSDLSFKLDNCVKNQEFQFYKNCNVKQQERVLDDVRKIFEANLSDNTRQLISQLPQFKQEVKQCISMQNNLKSVTMNVSQIEKNIEIRNLESKIEKRALEDHVNKHFKDIESERKQMQQNIETALSLKDLIKTKMDEYSDQVKADLRHQNELKNKQLYSEIKKTFADKQEQTRKKELENIVDERKKLFDRCEDITKIGDNLTSILGNFSTKFTKLKSDNELFLQRVSKQLEQIDALKFTIQNNNSAFGKLLAELTQAILATYCIEIHQQSPSSEQIMLTTEKDGVIYQKLSHHTQLGKIIYRRKHMDPAVLRKAVALSLLEVYDQHKINDDCLKWKQHSPNSFFKDVVEPMYCSLAEKRQSELQSKIYSKFQRQEKPYILRDTIDMTTIPARQTISTSFERPFQTRNISTSRSKRSRYTEHQNKQIFAHKSSRRFRIPLNTSLGMT